MCITRRDILSLLPGILAAGTCVPEIAAGSTDQEEAAALPSATYPFQQLKVHGANGGAAQIRSILKGKLATGESIEVHETTLAPGGAPHPPHSHEHSEMWLIREGTVELNISGKAYRLSEGSVGFVRSNEKHGISNPSDKPATYFVVAVGPGVDH
jgi:quercetin dioxygenase-like cupin family protein